MAYSEGIRHAWEIYGEIKDPRFTPREGTVTEKFCEVVTFLLENFQLATLPTSGAFVGTEVLVGSVG